MSKKLKRSAVALVLAATMVFSSQGVLTAFAAGGDIETEASVSSALEPILDNEETVVVEEPGNTDETETPEVTEPCGITEGCTLSKDHEGECQVAPVDPPAEGENGEGETQSCTKTEGCTLENGHEGECVTEPVTPPEEENGEDETQPCEKTEGCTLPNGHEGECVVEENTEDTEDTQEPSEEDVAAAKNVSDLIGALPEASTLDPETTDVEALTAQVKAAREAYDKLTDAQKALVEKAVLDKLVALEGALEGLEQVETIPDGMVARINGETYATLDAAIEAATDGATIELLADCTTAGLDLHKSLTITAAEGLSKKPTVTFTDKGIALWGISLTFKNCDVVMNGIGSTPYTAEWGWMTICASVNASLTLDNVNMTMDATGTTNSPHAIYFCQNNVLNIISGSNLTIKNYANDALEWDGGNGGYNVNITDSTFISDHNRSGFVGTFWVTATNSIVEVINSTGNGSNGSHFKFIDCNESNGKYIEFSHNVDHGISAGNLIVKNSLVKANDNGRYGIYVNGDFLVDSMSKMEITQNSHSHDCAGLKLTANVKDGLVESGATVNITGNYCSGLSNNGKCVFEDDVNLTITGNQNSQGGENSSHGGGVYNSGSSAELTLPSDAVIYNNHALTDGDDIFNNTTATITFGKVGEGWTLEGTRLVSENKTEEECGHAITGWFDDSANNRWNVHTGPVHAELYNEFDETTGLTTITGLKALKAAHPYQYDPDAPTEPSEPVDWETSKSKTATNLDKNYESQVTLSLPAKDEQLVSDVVFVLDKSTSTNVTDEIKDMLDSLAARIAETDGAAVNVGVVSFNQTASIELPLTRLTADNLEEIKTSMDSLEQISGTNMNAGLLAGKEMLDNDTDVDASRKYMIIVSDGISYYYCKGTDYKTAYTIASLNGGDDGNGNKNCQPNSGASCFEIKYGATNIPNWIDWYADMPGLLSSEYSTYEYNVDDPNLPSTTDLDSKGAIPYADRQNYPINVDISLYSSYNLYQEMLAEGYHCYSVFGREDNGVPYAFGPSFMEYMGGDTYLGESGTTAFETIENDIFYLLDAGSSVIDVIGGDDNGEQYDYDFDFVNDLSKITLTVNGVEKPGVLLGENHYGFGEIITDPDSEYQGHHEYELTYYPNGLGIATMAFENEDVVAGELFRWDIYVPVKQFEPVQLTYTVKLANPKTTEGNYGQYDEDGSENYAGLYTNNSAVLFPVDSNGNVGEKEAFDKPTVSYTVGSNDHPGTDPTPDPDPDPDRPSRPSRDDDDDWEPLPDAPVKDKPTTEVDVPEETETPTTEQPDKYNPETGDTTTVFAAMALAAVSLGGVVLLGRKKK